MRGVIRTDMTKLSQAMLRGRSFWAEEQAPTVTEYAVLLALIVFGAFGVVTLIGLFLKSSFTSLSDGIPDN